MTHSLRALYFTVALAASVASYPASAARELHVAMLGDSLAYGAGDESGKGIAGRLEPELRGLGIDSVVTTNLAANGATTRDLRARLQQPATRAALARADAVVLSIGANDVRLPLDGERPLPSPLVLVGEVLRSIDDIVAEVHRINPETRILILGGYTPVAHERVSVLLGPLIALWDGALTGRFAGNPRVFVVRLSDIVDRPERLSTLDSFHPGGDAYQEAARRIAELLADTAQ